MDVATMVAINNLNMVTVMAVQAANNVITIVNGERMEEDMDGSMLDQYMGKRMYDKSVQRSRSNQRKAHGRRYTVGKG